jgi:UDP-N-acetylglucosamine 2-epimerase (non-hydrolysing)
MMFNNQVAIVTGTKAMMIKMLPLVPALRACGFRCYLVDMGQHGAQGLAIAGVCLDDLPIVHVVRRDKPVTTWMGGIWWMFGVLQRLFFKQFLLKKIFAKDTRYVLVHGDTISTLLGALLARRTGLRVVHVESGLRSFKWFNPFPEEIVRLCVMRIAHILVAPSVDARDNISKMGMMHKCWYVEGNTNLDAFHADSKYVSVGDRAHEASYGVITLHRAETLFDKAELNRAVEIIMLARQYCDSTTFVVHPVTERVLKKHMLWDRLQQHDVSLVPLVAHSKFLALCRHACFVLTDGGSVQEECSYSGVPCLLLRHVTERGEGVGKNVVVSNLDIMRARHFFENYAALRTEPVHNDRSPSDEIARRLLGERDL